MRLGSVKVTLLFFRPRHEFSLLNPVLQVLVHLPLVGDCLVREGIFAGVTAKRLVVAGPDPVAVIRYNTYSLLCTRFSRAYVRVDGAPLPRADRSEMSPGRRNYGQTHLPTPARRSRISLRIAPVLG